MRRVVFVWGPKDGQIEPEPPNHNGSIVIPHPGDPGGDNRFVYHRTSLETGQFIVFAPVDLMHDYGGLVNRLCLYYGLKD